MGNTDSDADVVVGRTSGQAPSALFPSDGVFGRFDLAALRGCHA
jgi:hypothetical protein